MDARLAEKLRPHQIRAVEWMVERETRPEHVPEVYGGILADDVGLGKTYTAAALLVARPARTLIVVPPSLVNQWHAVILEVTGSRAFVLRDKRTADSMASMIDSMPTVLTTYSLFCKAGAGVHPALRGTWERVILDEAHVCRNGNTHTFKNVSKLEAVNRWGLTATPIQNGERDLRTLAVWIGAPETLPVEAVRDHLVLRRTKADAHGMTLTRMSRRDDVVVMDAPERALYDMVERAGRAHATVAGCGDGGGGGQVFQRVMTATLRARQICTHPALLVDAVDAQMTSTSAPVDPLQACLKHPDIVAASRPSVDLIRTSAKLRRLCELVVTHAATEKMLVFCSWHVEMNVVQAALETVGVASHKYHGDLNPVERATVLRNFEGARSHAALVVMIQCGGVGLNLQAASRVYLMGPHWNPAVEDQAVGRAHRMGQTRDVVCVRFVAQDSVDGRCIAVQDAKTRTIDRVIRGGDGKGNGSHVSAALLGLLMGATLPAAAVEDVPEDLDEWHDGLCGGKHQAQVHDDVSGSSGIVGVRRARARDNGVEDGDAATRETRRRVGVDRHVAGARDAHGVAEQVDRPVESTQHLSESDVDVETHGAPARVRPIEGREGPGSDGGARVCGDSGEYRDDRVSAPPVAECTSEHVPVSDPRRYDDVEPFLPADGAGAGTLPAPPHRQPAPPDAAARGTP